MNFSQPIGSSHSQSKLLAFVDHADTYGPHILREYINRLDCLSAVDIGAGYGRDLGFVKDRFPEASLHAIECNPDNISQLEKQGVKVYPLNIETDRLPFEDESVDLVICNQILEHTKEIFAIVHEITRIIKIGGSLIVGVPNVASLHNRIGLFFGKHPTQAKACSAHIRCFSKNDFLLLLQECFPDGYLLKSFDGSQFYPFPSAISRPLARLFPTMAFSIFFLLEKQQKYTAGFLDYPVRARLETNFRTAF